MNELNICWARQECMPNHKVDIGCICRPMFSINTTARNSNFKVEEVLNGGRKGSTWISVATCNETRIGMLIPDAIVSYPETRAKEWMRSNTKQICRENSSANQSQSYCLRNLLECLSRRVKPHSLQSHKKLLANTPVTRDLTSQTRGRKTCIWPNRGQW